MTRLWESDAASAVASGDLDAGADAGETFAAEGNRTATSQMNIRDDNGAALDATFSVEELGGTLILTYESRGPGRNTQYNAGLETLLRRLADQSVVIADIRIASRDSAQLSAPERRVNADGYSFPIALDTLDVPAFRRALGAAQARTARGPDAATGGNPTKRIEIDLIVPAGTAKSAAAIGEKLAGLRTARNYWALCANPRRYRIGDAVRELEIDFWTTAGRKIEAGDRVLIWQTLDATKRRGIVALGEVIGEATVRDDRENPYWVAASDAEQTLERVPVKYQRTHRLPLWLGTPGLAFLETLSVANAKGGTVFRVRPEQFQEVVDAAGGWEASSPEADDTDALIRGTQTTHQGRLIDPVARRVVERHAMDRAIAHFKATWPEVFDVSSRASFDLLCRNGDQELRVEVKGTTTAGATIVLTRNEVEHVRNPVHRVALFVTSEIVLDRTQEPVVASGGRDRVIEPWRLDESQLRPLSYECRLDAAGTK